MEVNEAHKRRRELERAIYDLVAAFEEHSGLTVESVDFQRAQSINTEHFQRTGNTKHSLLRVETTIRL